MRSQYEDEEVVEWQALDEAGNPVGDPLVVRYTSEGKVVDRLRSESGESVSISEENPLMETTVPMNPLAEMLGRLLPLAEKWLENQVGEVEAESRIAIAPSAPPVKEWYTPEEAGAEINRTPNHVRELCRKKIFGKRDAGGRWVINRKELEAFRLGRLKVHGEVFK